MNCRTVFSACPLSLHIFPHRLNYNQFNLSIHTLKIILENIRKPFCLSIIFFYRITQESFVLLVIFSWLKDNEVDNTKQTARPLWESKHTSTAAFKLKKQTIPLKWVSIQQCASQLLWPWWRNRLGFFVEIKQRRFHLIWFADMENIW